MENRNSSSQAWSQLQLVLDIFPRTDTLVGALLAIDIAMVAFFFSRWPDAASATPAMVIVTVIYALCSGLTFMEIYRCAFPNVEKNGTSVVFFGAVAGEKSFSDYSKKFTALDDSAFTEQVLEQVWRNSIILAAKFERLKAAMRWLLASLPAWIVFFIISTK